MLNFSRHDVFGKATSLHTHLTLDKMHYLGTTVILFVPGLCLQIIGFSFVYGVLESKRAAQQTVSC